ncbi:putative invertase inhibitor [Cornus florida]|uniref:putative invertase inhibitor n=1 Tax=Cornus florida TaxID=4283 RepID=UPI00289A4941|nr:putative invertase inhibitor [Cornus florida]
MRPPLFSLFLFSFSLYLFTFFHFTTGSNLINDTCKVCAKIDPNVKLNFCTTSLQAAPASECADLRGLGIISIRLVKYNVTDTRCKIKQLMKNKTLDPYVKACLYDCFQLYSDAIPSVEKAMKYYNSKNYFEANIQISGVMTMATTCEDGFKEKKGVVSPLTKRSNDTYQLSAIVLSIMSVIQNRSQ